MIFFKKLFLTRFRVKLQLTRILYLVVHVDIVDFAEKYITHVTVRNERSKAVHCSFYSKTYTKSKIGIFNPFSPCALLLSTILEL